MALLQVVFNAVVFFDIPILRQVIGFVCLTFIPGFLFVQLLIKKELETVERVSLSVGISVALLLISGLIINELLPAFGISTPLSLFSLMVTSDFVFSILFVMNYYKKTNFNFNIVVTSKLLISTLLLLIIPVLAIFGAMVVNSSGNNIILLLMIIVISAQIILTALKILPVKLLPIAVIVCAIGLLFHSSLVSTYIHGSDIQLEYFFAKLTQDNSWWNHGAFTDSWFGRINAALSVTLLPTVYSNILNISLTWTLKIIFPLIFSFVLLVTYQFWKQYVGNRNAYFACFLIISQTFFVTEILGLGKQMIAELFFVSLFWVILSKKFDFSTKTVLISLFTFGLVSSHYTTSILFLIILGSSWVFSFFLFREDVKKYLIDQKITIILLILTIMFMWYIYIAGSASFNAFLDFGNSMLIGLKDFFVAESRGSGVLRGLGFESAPNIWNMYSRVFAYAVEILVVFGLLLVLLKRRKSKFDDEYINLAFSSAVLLGIAVIVPRFASYINMTRIYHICLLFLGPFFIISCQTIAEWVWKKRKTEFARVIAVLIILPLFLFQSNFIYEVAGTTSWSVPLSGYRMGAEPYSLNFCFVQEAEVYSATWMAENLDYQEYDIYAEYISAHVVLTSYGALPRNWGNVVIVQNNTQFSDNSIIFLSKMNVVDGIILAPEDYVGSTSVIELNSTEVFSDLIFANKLYSNGGSEVYYNFD